MTAARHFFGMQLDADLKQRLAEAHCRHCGTTGAVAVIGIDHPAFGRVVCAHLAEPLIEAVKRATADSPHYLDWLSKPEGAPKRRTKRRHIEDLGERCEICLRHVTELPAGVKLNSHHVHEVFDEGPDTDVNLRPYCSDCHALVHWVRRTVGREEPSGAPPGLAEALQQDVEEPRSLFQTR